MNRLHTDAAILVVNPAGGNEPIIRGARIGLAVNQALIRRGQQPLTVIVPITGHRQRGVLLDELSSLTGAERVFLDEVAGDILRSVLDSQNDFSRHLQVLHTDYDDLSRALNRRYGRLARRHFQATDLAGRTLSFDPMNIIASLDIGGRIAIDTVYRDFAFPVLTSELLRSVRQEALPYDSAVVMAVEQRMRQTDNGYGSRFLPLVHTLSGAALSAEGQLPMAERFKQLLAQPVSTPAGRITYVPPLKSVRPPRKHPEVPATGVYAMLSGTDAGVEATFTATRTAAIQAGLTVYTVPWADEQDDVLPLSPNCLNDPRIEAIVGRAGWGTGWLTLNTGKTWLVIPPHDGDDPEILFNHMVIEQLGIGAVIDPSSFDGRMLRSHIATYGPRVKELYALTNNHFGTNDGNSYVAELLAERYAAVGL